MSENRTHAPPLRCRIAAKLVSPSPSVMLCKCMLGRRHQIRRCAGCSANSREIIVESLLRGFEDGLKSPLDLHVTVDDNTKEETPCPSKE